MAETDEVLIRYKADVSSLDAAANKVVADMTTIEKVGVEAFDEIGKAAQKSAVPIANSGKAAEKTKMQFNSLGNSIAQIGREIPNFAINTNAGIASLTNNIGPLFDSIEALVKQNKLLVAQGKPTVSVFSQIASSIFSLNTAVSIGVTLFAVYGKEIGNFVASLFRGISAFDSAKARISAINDAFASKDVSKAVVDYLELQRSVNQAQKGFAQKDIVLKKYNDTIGRTIGFAKDINEAEKLLSDNTTSYIEAITRRTAANQLATEAATLLIEKTRLEAEKIDTPKEADDREAAILAQRKKRLDESRLAAIKSKEDEIRKILELSAKLFEEGRDDQGETPEERKKRLDRELKDRLKQEEELAKVQSRRDKHAEEQRKRDESAENFERELDQHRIKRAKDLQDATIKSLDERYKRKRTIDQSELKDELDFSETSAQRRQEILEEQFDKGYITQREYADALKALEYEKQDAYFATAQAYVSILNSLSQIIGQNTEAGKAFAITETIISSIVATAEAFKQAQKNPITTLVPAYPYVAAASAAAAGAARIAAISSVKVPSAQTYASPQRPASPNKGFKDGVVDLQGPGTATSDSIPAYLSRGESVITARSTAAKREDLSALNKSVPDYEALINVKYVAPALKKERQEMTEFAHNIVRSVMLNFNDKNIVKAINKNKPATSRDVQKIADSIDRNARITKFESTLKQPK